ncbi:peptidylprolyl isomerase [Pseudopontixanthobacter vadosimaris]|uniref:peptidylprolyl isomerase n=1 Tax=Pseudopontixanthobacter vadosimaris TaxID=2726450 RepID=UPI00147320CE|nr:peptidylprolyl isomerase [Pseudopontixanthobacter vadosimaris]
MNHLLTVSALAIALLPSAAPAQDAPSPNAIVAAAPAADWQAISAEDLLVMELAPDRDGNDRRVVIQLMPPPFSQPWVENIRILARAGWYDGVSINRVQDNYVVQWGDADAEDAARARALPGDLNPIGAKQYLQISTAGAEGAIVLWHPKQSLVDSYADWAGFDAGWPFAFEIDENTRRLSRWPVHCYGMVGVGRGYSPDAGSGAELYTVIGHAPRHLDRNIALVGRVVEGIEHLSSLPRGTGDLSFYEDPAQRVPIRSVRLAADLPESERPAFEYLSTESASFANYADARANRRDPFFIKPAGGADICNIPVPVRQAGAG